MKFKVEDRVQKVGGDYRFEGEVVAVFHKRTGQVRLVVEDDRGLLFIFNEKNLQKCEKFDRDAFHPYLPANAVKLGKSLDYY